jgi:hypothetical protein
MALSRFHSNRFLPAIALASLTIFALLVAGCLKGTESQRLTKEESGWKAPQSKLSPDYVKAVETLLGNGLADPRGGTFSKVKILVSDAAWKPYGPMDALGWVKDDGKTVVCVDGVEYPVHELIGKADLDQFIAENTGNGSRFGRSQNGMPIASSNSATPGLLLVLGMVSDAEELANVPGAQLSSAESLFVHLQNRYRMIYATYLKQNMSKGLIPIAQRLEQVSRLRQDWTVTPILSGVSREQLLEEANAILTDAYRREKTPKESTVLDAVAKLKPAERTTALIEALDEVVAQQMGQPGGIAYVSDPIFRLLVEQGDAAIPKLIDCYEKDERLSRTVSFGRDFMATREIHSVRRIAWNAITAIWPSAKALRTANQQNLAAVLRAEWKENQSLTPAARWLRRLKDDSATPKEWGDSAAALMMSADSNGMSYQTYTEQDPLFKSLSLEERKLMVDLVQERYESLLSATPLNGPEAVSYGVRLRLAHILTSLEPSIGREKTLTELEKLYEFRRGENTKRMGRMDLFSSHERRMINALVSTGDPRAAEYFERFLNNTDQQRISLTRDLQPLWTNPKDPKIQLVGDKFFAKQFELIRSSESSRKGLGVVEFMFLSLTPMINSESLRRFFVRCLGEDMVMGTFNEHPGTSKKSISYSLNRGGGGAAQTENSSGLNGKPLIVSEYLASSISHVQGAPKFDFSWASKKKKEAMAAQIKWLSDPNFELKSAPKFEDRSDFLF